MCVNILVGLLNKIQNKIFLLRYDRQSLIRVERWTALLLDEDEFLLLHVVFSI